MPYSWLTGYAEVIDLARFSVSRRENRQGFHRLND
jgi:hypothetical protein